MLDPNEIPNGDAGTCAEALDDLLDAEQDAEIDELKANALVILGQLDPTETIDGKARWTAAQSKLILDASNVLTDLL